MHGERKRLAGVAAYVRSAGWHGQVTAAHEGEPADAPHLTEDAATLLVDATLRDAGSTQACTRDEVRLGFAYLTSPLVEDAVWTDQSCTAVVIIREAADALT